MSGKEVNEGWPNHFRVVVSSSQGEGVLPDLSPNLYHARRLAADAIKGGGTAFILQAVEVWEDKGATFGPVPLYYWPKDALDVVDHEDLPRFKPDLTPGRSDFDYSKPEEGHES
jgi:hypothetical protein